MKAIQNKYFANYILDDAQKWVEVPDARPVKIPGIDGIEFFAHHDELSRYKNAWRISEAQTGCLIWAGRGKLPELIAECAENLKVYITSKNINIQDVVAQYIKEHSISPRYKEQS